MDNKSFIKGFIKQASQYGIPADKALAIYKQANGLQLPSLNIGSGLSQPHPGFEGMPPLASSIADDMGGKLPDPVMPNSLPSSILNPTSLNPRDGDSNVRTAIPSGGLNPFSGGWSNTSQTAGASAMEGTGLSPQQVSSSLEGAEVPARGIFNKYHSVDTNFLNGPPSFHTSAPGLHPDPAQGQPDFQSLFRKANGTAYDPHSSMDKQKMLQLQLHHGPKMMGALNSGSRYV